MDDWTTKLDTYLDGELSAEEQRTLQAHLRTCSSCTEQLLNSVQLRRQVQSAGKRYAPAAEFRARVLGRPQTRSRLRWLVWAAPAAVLGILLGVLLAPAVGRAGRGEQLVSQLVDMHVATLASASPVDVVSSDRHTVKPWFQGRVPFTFNLPDLANSDYALVGGRVTYLRQTSGAHLLFQLRKHQISVFVFQDRPEAGRAAESNLTRLSFNVATWTQEGLRYYVIGDASREDVANLTKLLQAAGRS
jgi:anti-sigma factor RsiW